MRKGRLDPWRPYQTPSRPKRLKFRVWFLFSHQPDDIVLLFLESHMRNLMRNRRCEISLCKQRREISSAPFRLLFLEEALKIVEFLSVFVLEEAEMSQLSSQQQVL